MLSQGRALLRVEEVAQLLGISRARAYAMAADGRLPSVTIGRSRRVPVRELEAWIQRQVVDGRPDRAPAATTADSSILSRQEVVGDDQLGPGRA